MLDKNLKQLAFKGEPIPEYLPEADIPPYIMARCTYGRYKSGRITRERGESDIERISHYGAGKDQDIAMLNEFVGLLYEDHLREEVEAFPFIKALSYQLCEKYGLTNEYNRRKQEHSCKG